jgi:protein-disulfide isomerase
MEVIRLKLVKENGFAAKLMTGVAPVVLTLTLFASTPGCAATKGNTKAAAKPAAAAKAEAPADASAIKTEVSDKYICPETGMSITESKTENQKCDSGAKVLEMVDLMTNAGWPKDKIMSSLGIFVQGRPIKTNVDVAGITYLGSKNAPVTMVEFTDLQCPYCSRYNTQTFPAIESDYVKTGKVLYYQVNLPLSFHQNAFKAAESLYCANDQGKFWDLRHLLFNNQKDLGIDSIKKYAKDLGLDTNAFDECLDGRKYQKRVEGDMKVASDAGVQGTPGFVIAPTAMDGRIKGKIISGAQPTEVFKAEIDRLLNAPK